MVESINTTFVAWLWGLFGGHVTAHHWLGYLIVGAIQVFLLINLVAVGALIFIWMERKVSGRIQDRLGPTRVGGKFGWLQTLADGVKLIAKEDLCPGGADKFLFRLAPYVSFCASFTVFLAIPFATGWVAQWLNVGVFFCLAVLGLEVFGVILAGYSSASKWSLFGAMREAAQVVSYEVPLGMCAVVPVLICGTMDLVKIGDLQAGWVNNWLIFHDPFIFITFWVYITCATASVNRAPFDLAEAESELVAGFHTEYSGLRWSFFFMAEYGSMMAVSLLASILFLGGWHGPIPITEWLGLVHTAEPYGLGAVLGDGVAGYLGNLLGCLNVLLKGVVGVTVMMWVRWTLPRLRIDQVMTTCLKYCTPISAAMFLGAAVWAALLPGGLPGLQRLQSRRYGEVREALPAPVATPSSVGFSPRDDESASQANAANLQQREVTMGIYWPTFFFLLFALVACGFALAVVLTRNIVRMAFYLTLSLGATSGLFFLVGADFVGAMQLLIYVGGTLVLLIFGVMLTAQGPFINMRTAGGDWILAALVALPLLGILVQSAFSIRDWQPRSRSEVEAVVPQPTSARLGLGLLGARVDQLEQPDNQLQKGMSGYLLPFEIVSVHLLVVLIGAAYLARAKRRKSAEQEA